MGRHICQFGGFTESANEWKKAANHSQLLLLYIICACLVGVLLLVFDRFLGGIWLFCFHEIPFRKQRRGCGGFFFFLLLSFCLMHRLIANFGVAVLLEAAGLERRSETAPFHQT